LQPATSAIANTAANSRIIMDYAALVLGASIHGCEHGVGLDPAL
jgi:hypothetical protein